MPAYELASGESARRLTPVARTYAALEGAPTVRTTPEKLDLHDALKLVSEGMAQDVLSRHYKKHLLSLKDSHRLVSGTLANSGVADMAICHPSAEAELASAVAEMSAKDREKVQRAFELVRLMPPEQVEFVRWEGDRTGDRMVVPNTWLKAFLTTFVKTSAAFKLQAELIREHSLNEAAPASHVAGLAQRHAEQAGTVAQVTALSGTGVSADEAPAISVRATNSILGKRSAEPGSPPRTDFGIALAGLRSDDTDERQASMAFLENMKKKQHSEAMMQRMEVLKAGASLLDSFGCLDRPTSEWFRRVAKNDVQLMLAPPSAGQAPAAQGSITFSGTSSHSEPVTGTALARAALGSSAGPSAGSSFDAPRYEPAGTPFWWSAVSRAMHLNPNWRCKDKAAEVQLGRRVSDACLESTGMRPSQLNDGKVPQQDASGVARPTNVFSDAQALAWADDAIRAFFA